MDLIKETRKINNEIRSLILSLVDEETGEITPEANEILKKKEKEKEDVLMALGETTVRFSELENSLNEQIKRLQEIKKSYTKKKEAFKKLLKENILEGTKIYSDYFTISWRKSSFVDVDEMLVDFENLPADLKKVRIEVNKTKVKEWVKEGKPIPEGIMVLQKNNLIIK